MKINNIMKATLAACVALVMVGCNPDEEIKSITYPIQPSPVNFQSTETTSESVTLEWSTLSVADSCIIELFANDDEDMTLANDPTSTPTVSKVVYSSPATIDELESQVTYSARIKACGAKGESKYTVIEKVFKTSKSTQKQTASLTFDTTEGVKSSYEFGCITMTTDNTGGKMSVDANSQYFNPSEPKMYTARFKTGGASAAASNSITLKSTATGTLKIAVRSSSSTATRKLTVKLGDTTVATFSIADSNSSVVTIEGVDKTVYNIYEMSINSGTYTLEYDGGVNFYGFDVEYVQ